MARLIGLDETGKGEIIGDMVLCGAEIDSACSDDVEACLSAANTKNRRTQAHWERVSGRLAGLGVRHEIERRSPSDMPKGRTTKVMDDAYIKIIERLGPDEDTRITVDDYGIGDTLRWYLDSLPCAVTVKHGADVTHPEAKAASVLAKRVHVAMMGGINSDPEYVVCGCSPGSGNCGDINTKRWLRAWIATGREWPYFVRTWWAPVRKLEAAHARRHHPVA